MVDVPMITHYRGKDIRELSREELIAALEYATREIQSAYSVMRIMNRMDVSFGAYRERLNG